VARVGEQLAENAKRRFRRHAATKPSSVWPKSVAVWTLQRPGTAAHRRHFCRRRGDESQLKKVKLGPRYLRLLTSSPTNSAAPARFRSAAVSRRPAAATSVCRAALYFSDTSCMAKLLRLIPLPGKCFTSARVPN
jgi:hypothetical protein